ncbi:MAG: dephospho-CoA kinase [Betaproteobacteria bacterium]|nr:dephospho-CoA kinase [Betaproteobacteria bacterium]
MHTIGLTGGIGSGKSEAAKLFSRLDVPIVDTDIIAHSLTANGEPMLAHIATTFGPDFLNEDGALNRAKLRTHIFNNPDERKKLETLLHPAIYERAVAQLQDNQKRLNPDYQILVVPLLFEADKYLALVQETLVIDCLEETQIKRASARSHLTELEVKTIIQAQMSGSDRCKLANHVIDNNGTLDELAEKIHKTHEKFIKTCIVSK